MQDVYTISDLRRWQDATRGEPVPLRLAVFGDPVAHSRSPQMHNAGLSARGIHARYCRLHLREEELEEALSLLPGAGFLGVNLTIPHKVAAMAHLDHLDEAAQIMGAVNTVVISEEGKLSGFNTDGPGLSRAVEAEFGRKLSELRVAIMGAGGGAGRAIAAQCTLEGCPQVLLFNRTFEKAERLAEELSGRTAGQISAVPWESNDFSETDLIINASSIGMSASDPSVVPPPALRPGLLVYDTIYTAHRTPLVAAALEAGAQAANGLSMLLYQGVFAFEKWFGGPGPVEEMREGLLTR